MRRYVALVALTAACTHPGRPAAVPIATASPNPYVAPAPVRTLAVPKPTQRPARRQTPRPAPSPTRRAPVVRPAPPGCPRVPAVGDATQVVLVVSSGTSAAVRACRREAGRWVSVLGTAYGHVGVHGVAPAGAKREGDGRTPSGVFRLGFGFGVRPDPGVVFGWRRTTSRDVWVDDPSSSLYDTWQETPADGRWTSAERLYVPGAYDDVQVIDDNPSRVPGAGSAIFFHVDHDSPTAGCVSVPRAQLLAILRWERSGAVIAIR